ncbi:MAG: hypothetical protein IT461_00360 [Planctomycetes bacterium]|jgi:hypothetical protein|nr:hypothetical protein [Planctomycetota bacterium]
MSEDTPTAHDLVGPLLHQLNNDLSLIMGHLELALNSAGSNEKLLKRLEASRAAAQRMADRVRENQAKVRETKRVSA